MLRNFCYYVLRNLGLFYILKTTSLNFFVTKDKFLGLIRDQPKGLSSLGSNRKHTALILRQCVANLCVLRDLLHTDGPATGSH